VLLGLAGPRRSTAALDDAGPSSWLAGCARAILRRFDLQKQIDVLWQISERETGISLDVVAAPPLP
jgi:hypothetical protein